MRTHVFENESDNWYQVSDAKQRKRIQDRLAQRARRRRLAEASKSSTSDTAVDTPVANSQTNGAQSGKQEAKQDPESTSTSDQSSTAIPSIPAPSSPSPTRYCPLAKSRLYAGQSVREIRATCIHQMSRDIAASRRYFKNLEAIGHLPTTPPFSFADPPSTSPSSASSFSTSYLPFSQTPSPPVSHPLLPSPSPSQPSTLHLGLSPIALFSALWINGQPLSQSCLSSSADTKILSDRSHMNNPNVPPSLWPTEIQCSVEHWQWIDRFPFARFRDNVILGQDLIDPEEFLRDLFTLRGLEVREGGESWDPGAWVCKGGEAWGEKWGYLFL